MHAGYYQAAPIHVTVALLFGGTAYRPGDDSDPTALAEVDHIVDESILHDWFCGAAFGTARPAAGSGQ